MEVGQAGADINAPGMISDSPSSECYDLEMIALTAAALEGRLEILHLLLIRGAAVHGTSRKQYIGAVRAANFRKHGAAAALLEFYGGWTEEDERVCRAEHAAVNIAMKAYYKKIYLARFPFEELDTDDTETMELAVKVRLEGVENEWSLGLVDTDREFDDFFLEELGRLQEHSVDDDGWLGSF